MTSDSSITEEMSFLIGVLREDLLEEVAFLTRIF